MMKWGYYLTKLPCVQTSKLVLWLEQACGFQKLNCGFYKVVPRVVFPVSSTFVPLEGRKLSCDRYIARQHTITHKTRKTWREPFVGTDLCFVLPSNCRSIYFKETTCLLCYISDGDTTQRGDADSFCLAFGSNAAHFAFVEMETFIGQRKTSVWMRSRNGVLSGQPLASVLLLSANEMIAQKYCTYFTTSKTTRESVGLTPGPSAVGFWLLFDSVQIQQSYQVCQSVAFIGITWRQHG